MHPRRTADAVRRPAVSHRIGRSACGGCGLSRSGSDGGVGPQSTDLRVIGVDNLAGLCIGVAGRLGLDRLLERAIETPEHDKGIANGLQRVPGHYHLRRCIRAELQMQSGDRRCRYRIGRSACGGCGLSRSGSYKRANVQGRPYLLDIHVERDVARRRLASRLGVST